MNFSQGDLESSEVRGLYFSIQVTSPISSHYSIVPNLLCNTGHNSTEGIKLS